MKENLASRTADTLRNLIENGSYKPGEKLPNENILSNQLGISRTTLRESIRTLVSEGVLRVERGSGTFVTDPINQPTETTWSMNDDKVTLRDLYEARMIFEPEAAALACRRATDEEIEHILELGAEVQKQILEDPTGDARIASESAFHSSIIKASHNDFLSQFMPIITETIEKTFALRINLERIAEDAYKDHIMIMDFLKRRDAQGLKSAVLIHLHHAVLHEQLVIND